jgi:hypothetical protein
MSARLAGASVTRDRALDTCEPSYVPEVVRPFFIPVVHNPLEAVGYVAAPEPTSAGRRGPELRNAWWRQSSTQYGDDARGHVAAPELTLPRR